MSSAKCQQGRLWLKCHFCNTLLSSNTYKRHYESKECNRKLQEMGKSSSDMSTKMRRVAQEYSQRQVVSEASLIDFTEACSNMPEFQGIPPQALLKFGQMLLESHGTKVDSLNLTHSYSLKVPSPPSQQLGSSENLSDDDTTISDSLWVHSFDSTHHQSTSAPSVLPTNSSHLYPIDPHPVCIPSFEGQTEYTPQLLLPEFPTPDFSDLDTDDYFNCPTFAE